MRSFTRHLLSLLVALAIICSGHLAELSSDQIENVGSVFLIADGHDQSDQSHKAGIGATHSCHGTCYQLICDRGALASPLSEGSEYQPEDTLANSRPVRGDLWPPISAA